MRIQWHREEKKQERAKSRKPHVKSRAEPFSTQAQKETPL
jgi:hypothetical protein